MSGGVIITINSGQRPSTYSGTIRPDGAPSSGSRDVPYTNQPIATNPGVIPTAGDPVTYTDSGGSATNIVDTKT